MPSKLYPPYIEGSLPAFYLRYDPTKTIVQGASLTIPFSMNDAVGTEQVKAFALRLRTTSSGSYLFPPVYSTAFALDENKVTFNLTKSQAELLNEGQFYKVQIAYCGKVSTDNIGDDIGYFSTVGIIKCTSQPQIYINNLNANNVNFFSNDFIGVYDQTNCKDQSEKVYSYEFIVYDENEKIYFTTGEKLHQSVYDVNYSQSIDKVSINDFVASGVTYSIQYRVTTMNNLILSSQKYKITNENLVSPNKPIEILPEANEDNGYIKIKFKGELDLNKSWYYVLDEDKIEFETDEIKQEVFNIVKRQIDPLAFLKLNTLYKNNESNYIWDRNELSGFKKIRKNNKYYYVEENALAQDDIESYDNYYELIATGKELIKNISYKEAKEKYAYVNKTEHIYRVNNIDFYLLDLSPYESLYYGSYILSRSSSKDNYSTWSVINRFRLDGQRPTSYEVKDITVEHGRKYRYSLQQYNIWGLISSRILSEEVYATFEDMYLYDGDKILKIRYNPKVDSFKINVLEQKTDTLGGQFPYITRNGATWYKQFPIGGLIAQELDTDESFINRDYGLAHRHTTPAIQDKYNTNGELIQKADIPNNALRDFHAFTDENILLEREFKNAILEWLNNGNAKLFKSPYEGNYIVRLMQNTLSPVNELGRMLHSFTSQAYEIAECNYSNLVKYGFIKTIPPSDYSGLWKTYNLTDKNLINSDGDIEIKFDVGLNTFTVQDMMPGDIIYLLYSDSSEWEPIMIGITGSYTYVGSGRTITKLKIHPQSEISQTSNRNISGTIDCFYQGVRITAFDGITGQQLITIPSQQYVGVNPFVEKIKKIKWDTTTNHGQYSFSVSDAQYRELQNYNVKDFINDNLSQDSSGTFYKINDNFVRNIATFEPGDILQRINTTLNHGDSYKIDLLNIEQAKFRVREVIPVYVLKSKKNGNENEYEMNHEYNGTYQMVGEQILDDRSTSGTCYVSTSPYGYPHRIEELVEFEMLDPYCIFEVFEIGENENWQPISLTKGRPTQYYDPFYKTWLLYEYDPTFQINYTWKKVIFNPSENDIEAKNKALQDKADGKAYNEDLIFDYVLKKIDDNNYYYENNLKNKVYIQQKDDAWFTLYEKYNGQYYAYGYYKEPFKDGNEKIYFVKEYETDVNLLTVKEKEYKNLKNINSIKIGNGVMAELTFQIKVIDYYTEIINEDVKQAKEDYLAKKNFYSNLMKQYAIVHKANYVKNKSASLANAYDKLINGTNGSFLSSGDKEIIKNLLLNQYEKSQFNALFLYNVEFINNELPSALIEKLQNYKIDNGKLDLTTIQIFQMISPDDDQPIEDMFFIVNNNNIKCPIIKKPKKDTNGNILKDENGNIIEEDIKITNEDEDSIDYYFKSLPQIYRQNNSNDDIIFAVNKNKLIDFYNENYPEEQILFPDNYQILYADIYNKENIKDMIISKKQAYLNDGSSIGRLNKYIFNEKDNLYTAINENSQYFIGETYYVLNEENKYIEEKINLEEENNNKQYYIKNNGLSIKEWHLLTEEEKDAIQELSNFISIEKVEYVEGKTPLPFYEEKELQSLSNENNEEIEGVQSKLEDLNLQIIQMNEVINNLTDQITEEKNEYINLLNNLKEEIEAHNQNVLKNWAYNEIRRLVTSEENIEQITNYLTGSIENIENAKDEIINTITRYLTSCDRLCDLIIDDIENIRIYEQIKIDAANNQEDLKKRYQDLIDEKSGNILIYYTAFHNAIFQVADRIFNSSNQNNKKIFESSKNEEQYKNYIIQLQTVVLKYQNITQEINKNLTTFKNSLKIQLEKMKNNYCSIYTNEQPNYKNSTTYVVVESFVQLMNLYDDLDFIYGYNNYKTFEIKFNENSSFDIQIWDGAISQQDNDNFWNMGIKQRIFKLIGLGEPQLDYDTVLPRCTQAQLQRILTLKELYTFSYRKDLGTTSYSYKDNSPNINEYTTFIFYPLNENGKDQRITKNGFNNNKNYYDEELSENEKLQVLSTSSQLINIMLDYITNIYKTSDGSGKALSRYIKERYLNENKTYYYKTLDTDRDKIIGTEESNNFTKYNDKIRLAKSQLLLKGNLREEEKNLLFSFYSEESEQDLLFRQKYLVKASIQISDNEDSDEQQEPEQLPKIISYDNSILQQLSDVITDEDTGEITITDGIFKKYLDQIGGEDSLLLNQEILKQAQALLKLYQQQYNNYSEKYEQYTKESIEQEAIYNSYNNTSDGQEILNYYNGEGKTLEQYRMDVKEAWWKFLNLLDDRYTEEKERGMYI